MSDYDPNQAATGGNETQPGWYPDPSNNGAMRWYDGQQWGQFQEAGGVPAPMPMAAGGTNPQSTAAMAHYLGILGFIGPLIIMMMNNTQDPFVKDQSTEALNFHLTMMIGYVVSGVLMCVFIGFILFPVVWLASLVFSVLGGQAASKGEWYRYPVNIRMVK